MSSHPGVHLITAALATYRLTRLVTEDTLTEPIRQSIYARFGDPSTLHTARERVSLSYLASCPFCASIHSAAAVTVLALLAAPHTRAPRPVRLVAYVLLSTLALSGAVSAAHDVAGAIPKPGGWS